MDNLVLAIRGTPDQIVQRAMVIPRRRRPSYRSLTRGMCVRFAMESAFALPWKLRSLCSGIRVRFGLEYAVMLASAGVAVAASSMQVRFEHYRVIGGIIGTLVSVVFLL